VRKDPAVGKEHMEIESLPNEIQEPIMSPGRFNLNSSVRKQNSAPDGTKGGVRVQFPDAGHERVISDLRVGIEKEHVAAASLEQGQVVRPRESQVLMILNDSHQREPFLHRL
jgi:hypothetical protein